MPPPRFWNGVQLLAGWTVSIALFFLARWVLDRGVFRAVVNGGEVERLSGLWAPEFAIMTVVVTAVLLGMLAWLTGSWVAGRKARAALRRQRVSGHRKILM